MGQHILPNHDEGSIALRKLLDQEMKERKQLEAKVSLLLISFRSLPLFFSLSLSQIKRMEEEIIDLGTLNATMADQLNEMQSENDELTDQLSQFSVSTIERLVTITECESLESKVKAILQHIDNKKVHCSIPVVVLTSLPPLESNPCKGIGIKVW
jgi:hypothetical protein